MFILVISDTSAAARVVGLIVTLCGTKELTVDLAELAAVAGEAATVVGTGPGVPAVERVATDARGTVQTRICRTQICNYKPVIFHSLPLHLLLPYLLLFIPNSKTQNTFSHLPSFCGGVQLEENSKFSKQNTLLGEASLQLDHLEFRARRKLTGTHLRSNCPCNQKEFSGEPGRFLKFFFLVLHHLWWEKPQQSMRRVKTQRRRGSEVGQLCLGAGGILNPRSCQTEHSVKRSFLFESSCL